MTIRFRCKCGRKFEVADNMAGRKARCTDCGLTFLVPNPAGGGSAKPGSAAKPQQPKPAQDNSPLAMAARAAEEAAAAHGHGHHGAQPAQPTPATPRPQSPQPAPKAQAPKTRTPRPAAPQPPAAAPQAPKTHAPRPAKPAARPAAPAAQAPAGTYALQDDDDVPVARLATARPAQAGQHPMHITHLGKRKPKLQAIQLIAGISVLVSLVVGVDAIATMIGAFNNGVRNFQLIYGVMALFVGIEIVVALAATSGSRVCVGILIGGGGANALYNGPLLMLAGFGKSDAAVAMGKDAPMIFGIAGVLAVLLGIVYVLVPLMSQPVRKFIGASPAGFVVGAVLGFLFGPLLASTAQPSSGIVSMRAFTMSPPIGIATSGSGGKTAAGGQTGGQQVVINKNREQMKENMKGIFDAMSRYAQEWNRVPDEIGSLVDEATLPPRLFYCPSKGWDVKTSYDAQSHKFLKEPDVIYLFKGSRSADQVAKAPHPEQLIVAYSSPDCDLGGDGALVMRMPGLLGTYQPIEWLDKAMLQKQLAETKQWLEANPAPSEKAPDKLPGDTFGS